MVKPTASPIKFDDKFLDRYSRVSRAKTPILYFIAPEPGPGHQGYIFLLRKDGTGEAQLVSWASGDATDEIHITKAYLMQCEFYTSSDQWLARGSEIVSAIIAAARAKAK